MFSNSIRGEYHLISVAEYRNVGTCVSRERRSAYSHIQQPSDFYLLLEQEHHIFAATWMKNQKKHLTVAKHRHDEEGLYMHRLDH
jgi:hypothetical protein